METFKSIIRKSFLETFEAGALTPKIIAITIIITVLFAVYLFFVYRFFTRNSFYNRNFNLSLVGMAIVTAAIVLAIQSNLVLSLGMVGALSIVRYRSAVKDPMDLFFLFWSIAIGIMCGARQYMLTLIITIILSVLIVVLSNIPQVRKPFILVVNGSPDSLEDVKKCISEKSSSFKVKSNFVSGEKYRMIVELKAKEEENLVMELGKISGVSASILSYEGDIVG